ncbi:MAG: exonuclease domain-containing protein [Waddliaceae bacterium]
MIPRMDLTPGILFVDLEVNKPRSKNGDSLENITEFAALDPERPKGEQGFVAYLEPQIEYEQKPVERDYTPGAKVTQRVPFRTAWYDFKKWVGNRVVVIWTHNDDHDKGLLETACARIAESIPNEYIFRDTVILATTLGIPGGHSLQELRKTYNIEYIGAHEAWKDVQTLNAIFLKMVGDASRKRILEAAVKPLSEHPYKGIQCLLQEQGPLGTVVKTHLAAMMVFIRLITTGADPKNDRIAGVAAYIPSLPAERNMFFTLVNPRVRIPPKVQSDYGITDAMLEGKPAIEEVIPALDKWVKGAAETAHKVAVYAGDKLWDLHVPCLQTESERVGLAKFHVDNGIDTNRLSNSIFKRAHRPPDLPNNFWLPRDFHELTSHCERMGIPITNPKNIQDFVVANAQLFGRWTEGLDPEELDAMLLSKRSGLNTATLIYEKGRFSVHDYFRSLMRGPALSLPPPGAAPDLASRTVSTFGANMPASVRRIHETAMVVWYDLETRGLKIEGDGIVEVAAIVPALGVRFVTLVKPGNPIPEAAQKVHHISDEMVKDAPPIEEVIQQSGEGLSRRAQEAGKTTVLFAGHNIKHFDNRFLEAAQLQKFLPTFQARRGLDTLILSRSLFDPERYRGGLPEDFVLPDGFHKLQSHIERMGIPMESAHRAFDDIQGNLDLFRRWVEGVDPKKLEEAILMDDPEEEIVKLILAEGKFRPLDYLRSLAPPPALATRDGFEPYALPAAPASSSQSRRGASSASSRPQKKQRTEQPKAAGPGPLERFITRTRVTPVIQPAARERAEGDFGEEREFVVAAPRRSRRPGMPALEPAIDLMRGDGVVQAQSGKEFVGQSRAPQRPEPMEVEKTNPRKRKGVAVTWESSDEDTVEDSSFV